MFLLYTNWVEMGWVELGVRVRVAVVLELFRIFVGVFYNMCFSIVCQERGGKRKLNNMKYILGFMSIITKDSLLM